MTMNRHDFTEALYQKALQAAFPDVYEVIGEDMILSATLSKEVDPITGHPLYCVRLHNTNGEAGVDEYAHLVMLAPAASFRYLAEKMNDMLIEAHFDPPWLHAAIHVHVRDVYKSNRQTVFSVAVNTTGRASLTVASIMPGQFTSAENRVAEQLFSSDEARAFIDALGKLGSGEVEV